MWFTHFLIDAMLFHNVVPVVSFVCNVSFFLSVWPSGICLLRGVSLFMNFPFNPRPTSLLTLSHSSHEIPTLVSHVSFYDDHSIGLNRLPVCFLPIDFCLFEAKIISDWSPCPQDVAHNNSSVEWHRTSYQVGRASWVGTANEGTETLLTVPHLGPIFDSS